ncbi:MAG: ASCH domain-containing protein [Cyanobacteriota bacterium]|nr:ASCH domain-containing protein [Cyanobacteriota bacterium]
MTKVLTIKQPWAWLIAEGIKTIENRTWKTNYRGPLGIHAGKSNSDLSPILIDRINGILKEMSIKLPSIDRLKSEQGHIIAIADLTPITTDKEDRWAIPGQYHWKLENARRITPIQAKGKLGLWNHPVPLDIKSSSHSHPVSLEEEQLKLPQFELSLSYDSLAIAHGLPIKN